MKALTRLVAIGVALVGAIACNKPAALAFEPKVAQLVIDDDKGVKAPNVTALDKDGNRLEADKTPAVAFTSDPMGIVTIDTAAAGGPRLVPQKNGDTKLHAEAPGLPAAEVPVHVAVVDDVKLACPSSISSAACVVHVGELLHLDVGATGLGEKITTGIDVSSSDPGKADVDKTGTITAKEPGIVTITAKAGKKSANVNVDVRPAVDELRLLCPWPPIVVVSTKTGEGSVVAGDRSCEVVEGDEITMAAQVVAQSKAVDGEKLEWKSSDPSVRVVGGVVTADKPGGSVIEVHVADLVAEIPVSVVSGKQKPHCSEDEGAYSKTFDTPIAWKNANGEGNDTIGARCEQASAKKCLADGAKEIGHAIEKLAAFDATSSAAYARTAFAARAARCCCKPAAASTTAEH